MLLSGRYALRVTGLRADFYKVAADDPVIAKMLQPALERRGALPASDDLEEVIEKLQGHMTT